MKNATFSLATLSFILSASFLAAQDCGEPCEIHWWETRSSSDISTAILSLNPSTTDAEKHTPLHRAAAFGTPAHIESLVAAGADPNATNLKGRTPLHLGVIGGVAKNIEALVAAGAKINAKDGDGATPLQIAVTVGTRSSIDTLINLGADENITNSFGHKPIDYVRHNPQLEGVKRENIFSGSIAQDCGLVCDEVWWQFAEETEVSNALRFVNPNATENGETPLHNAARFGSPSNIGILLSAGAKIDVADSNGETPLHHAATNASYRGVFISSPENIGFLLNAGANPNVKDSRGQTPLHYSVLGGTMEVIKVLISAGAVLNIKDESGSVPFDYVHYSGSLDEELVRKLFGMPALPKDTCAEVCTKDWWKMTPTSEITDTIMKMDPNANAQGMTPIIMAMQYGTKEHISVLVESGADVNVTFLGMNTVELSVYNKNLAGVDVPHLLGLQ